MYLILKKGGSIYFNLLLVALCLWNCSLFWILNFVIDSTIVFWIWWFQDDFGFEIVIAVMEVSFGFEVVIVGTIVLCIWLYHKKFYSEVVLIVFYRSSCQIVVLLYFNFEVIVGVEYMLNTYFSQIVYLVLFGY
jgi:hypothetical protein